MGRNTRSEALALARVGERAPSFRLKVTGGSEIALDDMRGKVVLLNFFATWCGACRRELPQIQRIWSEYGGRSDFALLVVGREETDVTLQAFKEEYGYSFPVAADPDRILYSKYASEVIPRTYVITRDGTISCAIAGANRDDLDRLNRELVGELNKVE